MPTFNPNAESMDPISIEESARLLELEKIIIAGQQTFFEVGMALAEIMQRRLYRSEYKTFEDYCRTEYDWSSRYAQMVAAAAKTVYSLPDEMRTMVRTERAARALTDVPEPRRVEVLAAAGDQPTARSIKEAAGAMLAPADKPKRKYTKRNLPAVSGPPAGSANARSAVTPPTADSLQGGATAARLAHNQEVGGSIPSPATILPETQPAKLVSDEVAARQLADRNFFAIQFEEIASAVVDDGTDEQLEAALKAAKKAVKDLQAEQKQRRKF